MLRITLYNINAQYEKKIYQVSTKNPMIEKFEVNYYDIVMETLAPSCTSHKILYEKLGFGLKRSVSTALVDM